MKRKMLSKYGVFLTEVEGHEGDVQEKLILVERTLNPLVMTIYATIAFTSIVVSVGAMAADGFFLHANEGEQFFHGVVVLILCFLGITARFLTRHNFQEFTSVKSELFYYNRIYSKNLDSPESQLMLGRLVENGEFEHGIAQISKEHNNFIKGAMLPNSPAMRAAEEQKIKQNDVERSAKLNDYMSKLMQETSGS